MTVKRKFLGEMLIDAGVITTEQLQEALEYQNKTGVRLGRALVQKGITTEESIVEAIGQQTSIPYINLDTYIIDHDVLDLIPESTARENKILPLFKISTTLTIAISDPFNIKVIDKIGLKTGYTIETVITTEKQITNAISFYYGSSGSFHDIAEEIDKSGNKPDSKPGDTSKEAPIIRMVNNIIQRAVNDNASDIHIEPIEDALRVRYRIDGILHESIKTHKHLQAALLSRIKVLAHMDISETRIPQDGRFQMTIEGKEIEMRVSSFPTIYGENIVIRILDQSKTVLTLDKLGLDKNRLEKYTKALNTPYGIILVTGPTGSGKTTTLYASLNSVNSISKNIITVEDPVEYRLNLIRQTQINPKAGLTFATGIRAILRQDPDIIMVGEMRDIETSETAFQAALTGHLVFSTLHTNDAAGALARLIYLGIEPFLVASSTVCVIAQRLVRKICPQCKSSHNPPEEILKSCNYKGNNEAQFYMGRGCKQCRHSGYHGRIGIYEIMIIDEIIKNLILKKASVSEIRQAAVKHQGMKTLRQEGFEKALSGITTLEEVTRLTFDG